MLHITKQDDGNYKITADSGKVKDKRTNRIYSEVVCEEKQVSNFVEG